jgi:rod shape-determining protein MreB and related proteins
MGKVLKIGIDLGTANTLVYTSGRGIVYNEPTVIACDKHTNKIIAIGNEAKEMIGKEHNKIRVITPVKQGAIADKDAAVKLLDFIFENKLMQETKDFIDSTVLLCCHSDLSSIEKEALKDIFKNLGIKQVLVQEEVKAGAIGAGIDIYRPDGSMIIDIGAGSTDVGVLSLGDIIISKSTKTAGNSFDYEIKKYIKVKYNFEIGMLTAEKVKIALATLREDLMDEKVMIVLGRDLRTGLPSKITVKQSEIRDVLLTQFNNISNTILKVLEVTPPEVSADVINSSVIINGGGANIDGLKEYLENILQLDVKVSTEPLMAVIKGTKELLKNNGNYLVAPND